MNIMMTYSPSRSSRVLARKASRAGLKEVVEMNEHIQEIIENWKEEFKKAQELLQTDYEKFAEWVDEFINNALGIEVTVNMDQVDTPIGYKITVQWDDPTVYIWTWSPRLEVYWYPYHIEELLEEFRDVIAKVEFRLDEIWNDVRCS